jgi:hypothetical protein
MEPIFVRFKSIELLGNEIYSRRIAPSWLILLSISSFMITLHHHAVQMHNNSYCLHS